MTLLFLLLLSVEDVDDVIALLTRPYRALKGSSSGVVEADEVANDGLVLLPVGAEEGTEEKEGEKDKGEERNGVDARP